MTLILRSPDMQSTYTFETAESAVNVVKCVPYKDKDTRPKSVFTHQTTRHRGVHLDAAEVQLYYMVYDHDTTQLHKA